MRELKTAVYRTVDTHLIDLNMKLGSHRSFKNRQHPLHLIQLREEGSGAQLIFQTNKILHRGPVHNSQNGEISFPIDDEAEKNLERVIHGMEESIDKKIVDFLLDDEKASSVPAMYRAHAREAKKSADRLRELNCTSIMENYKERCLLRKSEHVLRPSFKEKTIWLKPSSDFRIFDANGQVFLPGQIDLQHGEYEFAIRVGDVYIGYHGDSGYIASIQFRVVQLRYQPSDAVIPGFRNVDKCLMLPEEGDQLEQSEENEESMSSGWLTKAGAKTAEILDAKRKRHLSSTSSKTKIQRQNLYAIPREEVIDLCEETQF